MARLAYIVTAVAVLLGCGDAQDSPERSQQSIRAAADDFRVRIDRDAVTVHAHDARIMDILEEIARQSGIALVLHDSIDERATVEFEHLALQEALKRLLHPRGFLLQSADPSAGARHSVAAHLQQRKLWVFDELPATVHAPSRVMSADALEALESSPAAQDSIADLSLALSDADANVRLRAVTALTIIEGDRAAAALASAALSDSDSSVRQEAVHALGEIGRERAIPALRQALIDPDTDVREAAIDAFANIGGRQSALALGVALDDPDASVRTEAVDALGEIGGETAIQFLRQVSMDEHSAISEAAAELLTELSGRAPP